LKDTLTAGEARRIALGAQGFAAPRPEGEIGRRQLLKLVDRLGVVQIDSVNVVSRTHYLPAFSRLGAYPRPLLEELAWGRKKALIEYWGHEASLTPAETHPLLRWRMERFRQRSAQDHAAWSHANGAMIAWLKAELAEKGPMPASAIEHDANKRSGPWWGWCASRSSCRSRWAPRSIASSACSSRARPRSWPSSSACSSRSS